MKDEGKNPIGDPDLEMSARPKASEWLWRPWYAKLWWALTFIYWICLEGSFLLSPDHISQTFVTMLMALVLAFNPLTVLGVLGYGFARAKIARGDWVYTPGPSPEFEEWRRRERREAETNPADSRSGVRHLRHIGVIKN